MVALGRRKTSPTGFNYKNAKNECVGDSYSSRVFTINGEIQSICLFISSSAWKLTRECLLKWGPSRFARLPCFLFFIPYSSVWGDFSFVGVLCVFYQFSCVALLFGRNGMFIWLAARYKKNGISTATNLERLIPRPRPFGSADPRAAFSFPPKSWCHRGTSASICRSQYFRLHWVFHISHLGLTLSVQFTQTREGHYGWRTCQITGAMDRGIISML